MILRYELFRIAYFTFTRTFRRSCVLHITQVRVLIRIMFCRYCNSIIFQRVSEHFSNYIHSYLIFELHIISYTSLNSHRERDLGLQFVFYTWVRRSKIEFELLHATRAVAGWNQRAQRPSNRLRWKKTIARKIFSFFVSSASVVSCELYGWPSMCGSVEGIRQEAECQKCVMCTLYVSGYLVRVSTYTVHSLHTYNKMIMSLEN